LTESVFDVDGPVDKLPEIDRFLDPPNVRDDGEARSVAFKDGVSSVPVECAGELVVL